MILHEDDEGRKTPTCDSVRTYLPENLDLARHLPSKWHEYGNWVVGGLYLRHHTEKQVEEDDFRPTHSAVLKQVLPERNYREILDGLLDAKVIEQDPDYQYRAGHRSKAYRLADQFRRSKFRSVQLTHRQLVPKVRRLRARKDALVTAEVHRHLRDQLGRLTVTTDFPTDSLPLTCIRDRELFYTVCRQGRIHTPLTNLDREHRPFIRYDDKPLYMVDVANSQTLLMAMTVLAGGQLDDPGYQAYARWLNDEATRWKKTRIAKIPFLPPQPSLHHHPPPYVSTCKASSLDYFILMRDRCLGGEFYESLLSHVVKHSPGEWTRQRVKDDFWVVAYAHPVQAMRTAVGRAFRDVYPAVWEAIRGFYYDHPHGELPRRMQTIESYVCVWRACSRIMAEYPDAPLLTIHDCLLSDEEHIGVFSDVLREEYRAVFGVEPRLTTKPF